MKWCIVATDFFGTQVIGPYDTREQASGAGFSTWGESGRVGRTHWTVRELRQESEVRR